MAECPLVDTTSQLLENSNALLALIHQGIHDLAKGYHAQSESLMTLLGRAAKDLQAGAEIIRAVEDTRVIASRIEVKVDEMQRQLAVIEAAVSKTSITLTTTAAPPAAIVEG